MLDFETLGPVARRKFMDNRKLFYAAGLCSAAVDGKREGKGKSAGHVGGGGGGVNQVAYPVEHGIRLWFGRIETTPPTMASMGTHGPTVLNESR